MSAQNNAQNNGKKLGGVTGKGFLPGKSGNPGGRPLKRPISDRYLAQVEEKLPDDVCKKLGLKRGSTFGDAIALAGVKAAMQGKPESQREIREALEGKSPQRIEMASLVRNDINITVRFEAEPPALEVKPNGHSGS